MFGRICVSSIRTPGTRGNELPVAKRELGQQNECTNQSMAVALDWILVFLR